VNRIEIISVSVEWVLFGAFVALGIYLSISVSSPTGRGKGKGRGKADQKKRTDYACHRQAGQAASKHGQSLCQYDLLGQVGGLLQYCCTGGLLLNLSKLGRGTFPSLLTKNVQEQSRSCRAGLGRAGA
jgi:hypothetical protein